MEFTTDNKYAETADQLDSLSRFRERFYMPDPDLIYLDGNSLGRLLLKTSDTIAELTHYQWGEKLIESWNEHWYDLPEKLGNLLAPIIGASEGEVVVADSTSVNLYKLAYGALKLHPGRKRIVSDVSNFPTDLYILQGIIAQAGPQHELVLAGTKDGIYPDLQELEELINDDTALVVLSLVAFKSGYLYDLQAITEIAHRKGALILWDLSHAAGAVPIDLNAANADLAVGCTYKYLNGGPGSPAYLYVKKELQPLLDSPIQGWFGEQNPFNFRLHYTPSGNIRKYLAGTPPILSLAATLPGIEILLEAGIENLRLKSIQLSEFLFFLLNELLKPLGFSSGSPDESACRGSHFALRHPDAYRICQAMINPATTSLRVIPDFREPNIIRIGITPLYTSYSDLYKAIMRIQEIVTSNEHQRFTGKRNKVT
jgi:kynureninase